MSKRPAPYLKCHPSRAGCIPFLSLGQMIAHPEVATIVTEARCAGVSITVGHKRLQFTVPTDRTVSRRLVRELRRLESEIHTLLALRPANPITAAQTDRLAAPVAQHAPGQSWR